MCFDQSESRFDFRSKSRRFGIRSAKIRTEFKDIEQFLVEVK